MTIDIEALRRARGDAAKLERANALDNLSLILALMERAGRSDMGHLTKQQAGWFHEATELLHRVVIGMDAGENDRGDPK